MQNRFVHAIMRSRVALYFAYYLSKMISLSFITLFSSLPGMTVSEDDVFYTHTSIHRVIAGKLT